VQRDDSQSASLESWFKAGIAGRIEAWALGHGTTLECERLFTTGKSGAVVGVVILHTDGAADVRAILKLDEYDASDDQASSVLADMPEFEQHLVPELWTRLTIDAEWTVSMQALGGGDTDRWQPLSSLSGRSDSADGVATVARAMILEWNPDFSVRHGTLATLAGDRALKRIVPGGALITWVQAQFADAVLSAPRLQFHEDAPGRTFVNPLWLLRSEYGSTSLAFIEGRSHGDLHADNILLPVYQVPNPSRFLLIDLAGASMRSLSNDPANLLLSEIERFLALRPHLLAPLARWIADRDDGAAPIDLAGVTSLWNALESVGFEPAASKGLGAEWRKQFWCSVMGSALVLSSRERLSERLRTWFFLLASIAATRVSDALGFDTSNVDVADVGVVPDEGLQTARAAATKIANVCSQFDGTVTTIAVVTPNFLDRWALVDVAARPWNLLIDFDPLVNEADGAYSTAVNLGHALRLVAPGQDLLASHNATLWLAAGGLAAPGATEAPAMSLRVWRTQYLSPLRDSLGRFVSAASLPIRVILFGESDDRVRAVAEQILDIAGDRASLLIVATQSADALQAYEPSMLKADPLSTIRSIPAREEDIRDSRLVPTVPGGADPGGRIAVPESFLLEFDDQFELLHSLVASTSHAVDGVGQDFYRGRGVTWYELSVDADLPRTASKAALSAIVRAKLEHRSTQRHVFRHYPGAGGSTLVRRVAWDFHDQFPTLFANQVQDEKGLLERIQELARVTGCPVLAVIENTSDRITDWVFEQLRASSVPALLLMSGRGTGNPGSGPHRGKPDLSRELTFMSDAEAIEFRRWFASLQPANAQQVNAVEKSGTAVPFLFALAAFQDDFTGLEQYVEGFFATLPSHLLEPLTVIALVHRYAGVSIQASAFAEQLGYPAHQPARLQRHFGATADGLLIEERTGYWRTIHALVAQAILQASLRPKTGAAAGAGSDGWKLNLAPAAITLIDVVASACTDGLTDDMRNVLESTFIRRGNRELTRGRYSMLVAELPTKSRGHVFERLTEQFPEEPHFWAHRGRWLSFDAHSHPRARECFDEALRLEDRDPLLFHMRGTATRRELFDLLDSNPGSADQSEAETDLLSRFTTLANESLADFEATWTLDNSSDFALNAAAELCIRGIEWGKRRSGCKTYTEFLKRPSSAFYVELLDNANIALDRAADLRADDAISDEFAQLEARMRGVYDNFPAMISSWRNMIASANPPERIRLRSRTARLYGDRHGGWHLAKEKDLAAAFELLNANLLDDPTDPLTCRLWLRVARHRRVSLERAQEVVSNWVEFDKSRDALYNDYVLTALAALAGGLASQDQLEEKLARLQAKTQYLGSRRSIIDWLGIEPGFQALVSRGQVKSWERRTQPPPASLARIEARITRVSSNTSGRLKLSSGMDAFFTPAQGGFRTDDLNKSVTAVLGFSMDGVQAWNVRPRDWTRS
jgi:hypothetical protein